MNYCYTTGEINKLTPMFPNALHPFMKNDEKHETDTHTLDVFKKQNAKAPYMKEDQ